MAVALIEAAELEKLVERVVRKVLVESRGSDVLSVADAAAIAKRDVKTVRQWCETGALTASKRGRVWAIRRGDLERYLAGSTPAGATTDALLASVKRS